MLKYLKSIFLKHLVKNMQEEKKFSIQFYLKIQIGLGSHIIFHASGFYFKVDSKPK